MEVEAVDEGRIASLLVAEGTDNVAVGAVIAMIGDAGDLVADAAPAPEASPVSHAEPASRPAPVAPLAPLAAVIAPMAAPVVQDAGVLVSPLARRIAGAMGIALAGIAGSGPRGKIVKADLGLAPLATVAPMPCRSDAAGAVQPSPIAPAILPPPAGVPVETVKLSSMRRTIARRLSEAKQTVPHFYLTARCRIDALLKLRTEINADLAARGVKISVNDMVIKALAVALTEVPQANVQFGGDVLHLFGRVDISMAVAIEGGLVTPVIRDAGALSLSAIARASKALAEKARDGKLVPEDYTGGTASISNLGMFGIDEMVPVINPPQALILGVGVGVELPWKIDGGIGLATIMAATASFDHRVIDGAVAAQFMAALRHGIENPMLLLA